MAGLSAAIYAIYATERRSPGSYPIIGFDAVRQRHWCAKHSMLTGAFGAGARDCVERVRRASGRAIWPLGAAAVFFGLCSSMIFTIGATLAGPRAAGRWVGAQNVAGQTAGIIAPIVTGVIVDRTGGFSWRSQSRQAVRSARWRPGLWWSGESRRLEWTGAPVSAPVAAVAGAGASTGGIQRRSVRLAGLKCGNPTQTHDGEELKHLVPVKRICVRASGVFRP